MTVTLDFQVVDVLSDDSVTGRNCGPDIPAGTVFTLLCRRDFAPIRPGEELPQAELTFVARVALRLERVWWYGRSIDHVPRGHTAKLTLSGEGLDVLHQEIVRASGTTYFSLCN